MEENKKPENLKKPSKASQDSGSNQKFRNSQKKENPKKKVSYYFAKYILLVASGVTVGVILFYLTPHLPFLF